MTDTLGDIRPAPLPAQAFDAAVLSASAPPRQKPARTAALRPYKVRWTIDSEDLSEDDEEEAVDYAKIKYERFSH